MRGSGAVNVHVDDAAAFGHYLQATRERRQIPLELVSHRTKIATRLLASLEQGDVSAWPPGIYRRAMMRAYAEAVGVDREFALEQFSRLFDERPAEPAHADARGSERQRADARVSERAQVAAPPPDGASWLLQAAQLAGAATVVAIIVAAVAFVVRRVPSEGPVVHAEASRVPPAPLRAVMPLAAPAPAKAETVVDANEEVLEEAPAATEGLLRIASEPAGAVVTVNGIRRGVTPLTIGDVPLGEKRVRLILDGYISEERIAVLSPERAAAAIEVKLLPRVSRSPSDRTAHGEAGRRTGGSRPSRRSASAP